MEKMTGSQEAEQGGSEEKVPERQERDVKEVSKANLDFFFCIQTAIHVTLFVIFCLVGFV